MGQGGVFFGKHSFGEAFPVEKHIAFSLDENPLKIQKRQVSLTKAGVDVCGRVVRYLDKGVDIKSARLTHRYFYQQSSSCCLKIDGLAAILSLRAILQHDSQGDFKNLDQKVPGLRAIRSCGSSQGTQNMREDFRFKHGELAKD